jgi:hypothetical protein
VDPPSFVTASGLHKLHLMRHFAALLALATLPACADPDEPVALERGGSAELERIDGAPAALPPAPRAGVALPVAATQLAPLAGVVAIGTTDGVHATQLGDDLLDPLRVHPDQSGPTDTGAVRWLAPRTSDGLLVLAESGIFHAAGGYLLASPFGASVDSDEIQTITSFGSGPGEELWVTTADSAYWVADGKLTHYSLRAAPGPITLALGTAPAQAVVAAGHGAYLVDLAAKRALELASGLGTILAGTVEEDGSVHLATSQGVLSRARSGKLTLRSLADAGQAALDVRAISGSFGAVVALTGRGLVAIDQSGAKLIGEGNPQTGSVALDASGDAWTIEDGALFRYQLGKPVSFADDVVPFVKAHCDSCHAGGASSAPDHDFGDFETAKQWADSIARRLQATDATTMPPPNTEVLTAADYAVVLRWIKSGLLP